ncbi:MAG: hypothetical protein H6625_13005 [Bdellovibrionaceae bacterium]|nr:hypothetical protein [Pseudobdellovibrionaceae bacterium]
MEDIIFTAYTYSLPNWTIKNGARKLLKFGGFPEPYHAEDEQKFKTLAYSKDEQTYPLFGPKRFRRR